MALNQLGEKKHKTAHHLLRENVSAWSQQWIITAQHVLHHYALKSCCPRGKHLIQNQSLKATVSSSSVLRGEKVWPLTPRSLQQLSEMVVGWCVVMWGGYLSARRTNAAMNICYRRNKHQGNWNYGPTTQVSMNPTDPVVFRGKKHSTDDCRVWGISTSSTQCITGKIRFSSLILSGLIVFWQAQSKYWT